MYFPYYQNLDLKRRISLFNIAAVTVTARESQEFAIHIPTEYDYRFISPKYFL